jgi:hypothetical protein
VRPLGPAKPRWGERGGRFPNRLDPRRTSIGDALGIDRLGRRDPLTERWSTAPGGVTWLLWHRLLLTSGTAVNGGWLGRSSSVNRHARAVTSQPSVAVEAVTGSRARWPDRGSGPGGAAAAPRGSRWGPPHQPRRRPPTSLPERMLTVEAGSEDVRATGLDLDPCPVTRTAG